MLAAWIVRQEPTLDKQQVTGMMVSYLYIFIVFLIYAVNFKLKNIFFKDLDVKKSVSYLGDSIEKRIDSKADEKIKTTKPEPGHHKDLKLLQDSLERYLKINLKNSEPSFKQNFK